MDSSHLHRRPHKIRRTGRHATPSQVEKVAGTAAKAAPAVAIAGALVALPQSAHAEVKTPASATTVTEQAHTTALVKQAARTYRVRSGDTLSGIAKRFYGNPAHWTWIYAANRSKIHNPNSIFVGEKLTIPYHKPAGTAAYTPRHAKKQQSTVLTSSAKKLSGNLGCSGLEALWVAAGGAKSHAFVAAEIAMAESGGRQYAHSPTNDFGYWQINGVHGAMATYNPIRNAKAAIAISSNGRNWRPWTTYVTGAYRGRC
ncbi:MAG TPA: LysM peptidoglycan-binding domain-containing protein [Streptosporangiaceae bacterium]